MADRHYPNYAGPARSPTFGPARASLPAMPSSAYTSYYGGDIHGFPASTAFRLPTSSRYPQQAPAVVPRASTYNPDALRAPPPQTRSHRSSTLDSTATRPIIIKTTTNGGRSHPGRTVSPMRDEYRASDTYIYQPASSMPPRNPTTRKDYYSYSPTFESEDFARAHERDRDGFLIPMRPDAYRSARPTVAYPNPRAHNTTVDIGEDSYQYTGPSELARYDLDHPRPSRRRRESLDRYSRPTVTYNPERTNMTVSTDSSRAYNGGGHSYSRSFDNRGGPPPTTRGLNRVNRAYESASYAIPPAAPAPPPPLSSANIPVANAVERTTTRGRTSRPVSLYQDAPPRSAHHDDFYRSREDERIQRELRELDRESQHVQERENPKEDVVASRGFGIRAEVPLEYDDRHDRPEGRRRETSLRRETGNPPRRGDVGAELPSSRDEDHDRSDRKTTRARPPKDMDTSDPVDVVKTADQEPGSHLRDKALGLAATALGINVPSDQKDAKSATDRRGSPVKNKHSDQYRDEMDGATEAGGDIDPEEPSRRGRRRAEETGGGRGKEQSRDDAAGERPAQTAVPDRTQRASPGGQTESAPGRRESDVKAESENRIKAGRDSPGSDDGKGRASRRPGAAPAFDPNDTEDLLQVRQRLAALAVSEKADKPEEPLAPPPSNSPSPAAKIELPPSPALSSSPPPGGKRAESRTRSSVPPPKEGRLVRVVSPPPRDRVEAKPLKGILKPPSRRFPEDPHHVREGVSLHKNDEKRKEVPANARWTRISRKVVNPEALTIGQERFEVRDDFVTVLRVLSKEEIQAYAAATQRLREMHREEQEREDEKRRLRRRHRDPADFDVDVRDDDLDLDGGRDRDVSRRRRWREDFENDRDDEELYPRHEHHHHHRR